MATTITEPISEETYRELALADPNGQLELHCGQLQEKPGVSAQHSHTLVSLLEQLFLQLDRAEYTVRPGLTRLRVSPDTYYIPDIAVVPTALERVLRAQPHALDAYVDPLPLVVEVWSRSTGAFDRAVKIPDYQRRGDLEIWFLHPYERTLTAWRRQPDGSYVETVYHEGPAQPASLPNVTIGLDELFAS